MKMKFCHYHYEKATHPKFYGKACELLAKAKNCAFTSQNEVDIFVNMVKEALEKNRPEGHPSRVEHTKSSDGGQIVIRSGKLDDELPAFITPIYHAFWSMTWKRKISLMSATDTR